MSEPSIFSRIIAGEIPATVMFDNERIIVIKDIAPQAPLHLLVIPKTEEFANVTELAAGNPELMSEMVQVAQQMAKEHGNGEFRLVFNTGPSAGQTVFHVHAHILAGGLAEGTLA